MCRWLAIFVVAVSIVTGIEAQQRYGQYPSVQKQQSYDNHDKVVVVEREFVLLPSNVFQFLPAIAGQTIVQEGVANYGPPAYSAPAAKAAPTPVKKRAGPPKLHYGDEEY